MVYGFITYILCPSCFRTHCFHDYIYYAHLAFVRFEHTVCCGSLMTTYIMLLAQLFEHSLVHWYQQCVTVHHVPKCMSCHKVIVVITGRAHGHHKTLICHHGCSYYQVIMGQNEQTIFCIMFQHLPSSDASFQQITFPKYAILCYNFSFISVS